MFTLSLSLHSALEFVSPKNREVFSIPNSRCQTFGRSLALSVMGGWGRVPDAEKKVELASDCVNCLLTRGRGKREIPTVQTSVLTRNGNEGSGLTSLPTHGNDTVPVTVDSN